MKRLAGILSRMLGLVFLASALLKAADPKGFGVQIQMYGIVRQADLGFWIAISVILAEGVLGAALVSGWKARGWTLMAAGLLLLVFSALIAYGWVFRGLKDCGCMGKYFPMSPSVSILKNLVLLGMVWAGLRGAGRKAPMNDDGVRRSPFPGRRGVGWIRAGAFVLSVCVLGGTLALGVQSKTGSAHASTRKTADQSSAVEKSEARSPYARFVFEPADEPGIDLGTGWQFVVFLSASCEHCEAAVSKINSLIDTLGKDLPPVTGLVLGDEETLKQFRETTKPEFPTILIDPMVFFEFIGDAPPRFVLVSHGQEVAHWDEELPTLETLLPVLSKIPAGGTNKPSNSVEKARAGSVSPPKGP